MLNSSKSTAVHKLWIVLLWCHLHADPAVAQTGVHCSGDLLKLNQIHIPHAKLVESEKPTQPSQILCESVYTIPGRHARSAEALLIKMYGMGRLVFECCGWFPKNGREGTFKRSHPMANGAYASYSIRMVSEETVEKRWDNIANFYITLTVSAI